MKICKSDCCRCGEYWYLVNIKTTCRSKKLLPTTTATLRWNFISTVVANLKRRKTFDFKDFAILEENRFEVFNFFKNSKIIFLTFFALFLQPVAAQHNTTNLWRLHYHYANSITGRYQRNILLDGRKGKVTLRLLASKRVRGLTQNRNKSCVEFSKKFFQQCGPTMFWSEFYDFWMVITLYTKPFPE